MVKHNFISFVYLTYQINTYIKSYSYLVSLYSSSSEILGRFIESVTCISIRVSPMNTRSTLMYTGICLYNVHNTY